METHKTYSQEQLHAVLHSLDAGACGMVLRAKGIVAGTDGQWIHFDYVPGRIDVRTGTSAVTGKLCVIGSALNEAAVAELFGV